MSKSPSTAHVVAALTQADEYHRSRECADSSETLDAQIAAVNVVTDEQAIESSDLCYLACIGALAFAHKTYGKANFEDAIAVCEGRL